MDADAIEETIDFTLRRPETDPDDPNKCAMTENKNDIVVTAIEEQIEKNDAINSETGDKIYIGENGLFMLPKDHPDYSALIRLQLENQVCV